MAFKISFFGATQQVTGSQYVLETDNQTVMVDCGLDLERKRPASEIFAREPSQIDALVLTHAHIDHSGLIPLLVKKGFEGLIYCTFATFHLTRLLLYDSARIQQQKFGKRRRKPADYYTVQEVEACLSLFEPVDFQENIVLSDDLRFHFVEAGHLLGAAHVLFTCQPHHEPYRIAFSGDIGRKNYPLLPDPQPLPPVDAIVCEGTYGMRTHQDHGRPERTIQRIIREACVHIPGRLIIPTFSVGRTQVLLYLLHRLQLKGQLPPLQVFTDSPLAKRSTRVYADFTPYLNREAVHFQKEHGELFNFDNLVYLPDLQSAQEIHRYQEPCIIITSSGMLSGGKAEDHVLLNLENSYCTFLFIGYCAKGTLGRKLLDGMKCVRVKEQRLDVNARIMSTDILSGHADFNDLMNFFKTQDRKRLQHIFLVHGETEALQNMGQILQYHGYPSPILPSFGESFTLNSTPDVEKT